MNLLSLGTIRYLIYIRFMHYACLGYYKENNLSL